jgi:HSP20 family protein
MLMRPNLGSGLLEDFLGKDFFEGLLPKSTQYTVPAVNIVEDTDQFKIEVAAPGMQKSDFNIESENNILTISANRETKSEENQENFLRKEFHYSFFRRSFTLPQSIDQEKISAAYADGVLHVVLPKKEEARKPQARNIAIE